MSPSSGSVAYQSSRKKTILVMVVARPRSCYLFFKCCKLVCNFTKIFLLFASKQNAIAPYLPAGKTNSVDIINDFLNGCGQGRTDSSRRFKFEDSNEILRLHHMFTILIKFNSKPSGHFDRPHSTLSQDGRETPQSSASELRRLYRAMWRWQICSKIFCLSQDDYGWD